MSSENSESHIENIDKFLKIIQHCSAFGSVYNPANPKLSIDNMTLQHAAAKQLDLEHTVAFIATNIPINNRKDKISQLVKLMRRVKNEASASGITKKTFEDVKGAVDKFTGDKVRKKKPKEGEEIKKWVSNSHLSVAVRMETFSTLRETLRNEPLYAPNESVLTIAALDEEAEILNSMNNEVINATAHEATKRIDRDRSLYEEEDGLVDVSLMCKKYVKALYGAKSPEAMAITKIKLKRFMRIKKNLVLEA
jgi:hypothetical protein